MKKLTLAFLFAAAAAAAAPTGPAGPPPAPPIPNGPGKALWADTFAQARDMAARQDKFVFVEFTSDQCGNCGRMDDLLYPAVDFEMTLLRMVPVKIALASPEGRQLASRYGVNEAPATLVVTARGALVFRVVGFDNPQSYYAHISRAVKEWDAVNLRIVHEPETINDPASELALGEELFRRFDSEEAIPRLERAASSPRADGRTRENALAYLATAQLDVNRVEDSRRTVETLLTITKDPARRERAELFRAQISLAEGNRADGIARLERFLKEHPTSDSAPQARKLLEEVRGAAPKPPASHQP